MRLKAVRASGAPSKPRQGATRATRHETPASAGVFLCLRLAAVYDAGNGANGLSLMSEAREVDLAVLADRLERMTEEHKAMRESFDAFRISFAEFKNTPKDLANLKLQADAQGKVLDRHSFIIKLCGSVLVLCVGLLGWGWQEMKSAYKTDAITDRRLLLIEYRLNIPPSPTAEGGR